MFSIFGDKHGIVSNGNTRVAVVVLGDAALLRGVTH